MPGFKTLAAVAMAAIAALHIFAGGPDVHRPLLDAAPNAELDLYVTLLWHFVTLFLIGAAISFALAARVPERFDMLAAGMAVLSIGMGALFLALGLLTLRTPWIAPQWVLLFPVAALALWQGRAA